jgi:hypothetical protein
MNLSDDLLSRIHRFLNQNQYPSETDFCRAVSGEAERLIRRGRLTPGRLATRIRLPASYRRCSVKKGLLAEQVVACIEPLVKSFSDEVRTDVQDFMRKLKYLIRRDVARDIYNKGTPKEKPGRDAIRNALFGFFHKGGLVFQEVRSGRGFLDILVARGLLQVVVETKLSNNFVGIRQLQEYLEDDPDLREGYFFIFDTTPDNRFRSLCDVEEGRFPGAGRVHTLVAHVNLPIPSRKNINLVR